MRRTLALALLALLLLAPAAAAGRELADLRSSRVEAPDAHVAGVLAALELLGSSGALALSADRIDAVLEQESATAFAEQTGYPFAYRDEGPRNATYRSVQDGQAVLRDAHEVYVLPLPGQEPPRAAPTPGCAALSPSARSEVRPASYMKLAAIQDRHPEAAPTGDALAWDASCAPLGWTVTGAFLLTLWNADLSFRHADGDTAYTTGTETTERQSVAGAEVTATSTDRQLYLAVHGGRLQLPGSAAAFLASAELEASLLRVRQAAGTAALGAAPLAGEDVELRGRMQAGLRGVDGAVAVHITGSLDGASIGGRAVTVAAAGGEPGARLWLAALLLVPVAAGAGTAAWRRRPAALLARLERLALAGRHSEVARRSLPLQSRADLSAEATALRVEALARAGRTDEALAEADRLPPLEGSLARAYAHALAGDPQASAAALRACAALDPGWTRWALRDPVFAAARADPALRALHRGDAA